MDLNMSAPVLIRLTEDGRLHHHLAHEAFWDGCAAEGIVVTPAARAYAAPAEDGDGWSRWTLEGLFECFGTFWRRNADGAAPFCGTIRTADEADAVRIPTSKAEAQLMVRLGAMWLRDHEGEGVPR